MLLNLLYFKNKFLNVIKEINPHISLNNAFSSLFKKIKNIL